MSTEAKTLAPGTFCWVELATSDTKAAQKFYATLFHWKSQDMPSPDGSTYHMQMHEQHPVSGIFAINEEMKKMGVRPNWLSHIFVENADATAKKATELGGKTLKTIDVPEYGRMAIIQDPTNAVFAVWQPKQAENKCVYNVPNTLTWNELLTTDTTAAKNFYTKLFGWNTEEMNMGQPYTVVKVKDRGNGGIMALPEEVKKMGVPSHWVPYFAVTDADNFVVRAKELGATVHMPPTDIPNIGRFAVLADPQGAAFCVIKSLNPGHN